MPTPRSYPFIFLLFYLLFNYSGLSCVKINQEFVTLHTSWDLLAFQIHVPYKLLENEE